MKFWKEINPYLNDKGSVCLTRSCQLRSVKINESATSHKIFWDFFTFHASRSLSPETECATCPDSFRMDVSNFWGNFKTEYLVSLPAIKIHQQRQKIEKNQLLDFPQKQILSLHNFANQCQTVCEVLYMLRNPLQVNQYQNNFKAVSVYLFILFNLTQSIILFMRIHYQMT